MYTNDACSKERGSTSLAGSRGRWRARVVMAFIASLAVGSLATAPAAGAGPAVPAGPTLATEATDVSASSGTPLFHSVRQSSAEVAASPHSVEPMSTAPAAQYVPIPPVRVTDTRFDEGGPLWEGDRIILTPDKSVPAGITAVAFNVTATGQTASGYFEVAPKDAVPGSSTVNWGRAQQTTANGFVTRVNPMGQFQITMKSTGSAHVVLDITGYFAPPGTSGASLFTATDQRIYDSRTTELPLQPGEFRDISVGAGGALPPLPPQAAAINVTATGTVGSGVFTASPFLDVATSTINWTGRAQSVANAVIVAVRPDGMFTVTNNGQTPAHLVVDLTGVFTPAGVGAPGAQFYAMDPMRSYDSRIDPPLRPLLAGEERMNVHPVPVSATAIALNTTVTGTFGTGFISIMPSPGGGVPPATSTVNWYDSHMTRANGGIIQDSQASTYATAGGGYFTHYVLDVAGYFQ